MLILQLIKIIRKHDPIKPQIPDHCYKTLIIKGWESREKMLYYN